MVLTGRIDIIYAISSLARFLAGPRQHHLKMTRHIRDYLKKFPKRGIIMDPRPLVTAPVNLEDQPNYKEFTHQYKYYTKELDPHFPRPIVPELDITIFCNSDHVHDLVTGRSITGLLAFVGSTHVHWISKHQTIVQTSTFGAEFMALKPALELQSNQLRSMGVHVTKSTKMYVDNKSVCINLTNPASTLNKKSVALAYHYVWQHQSGKVINIKHIKSEDNYADILTKPLNSNAFKHLLYKFIK